MTTGPLSPDRLGLRGLLDDAEDHRERLREALVALARHVIKGDGPAALVLAADVLDEEKAGTL